MLGLMQSQPLLISSLIEFAARNHADGEIVSRRVEGDIHRYTYKDLAARSRQLANKLDAMGLVPGMPHFSFISLGLVAAGGAVNQRPQFVHCRGVSPGQIVADIHRRPGLCSGQGAALEQPVTLVQRLWGQMGHALFVDEAVHIRPGGRAPRGIQPEHSDDEPWQKTLLYCHANCHTSRHATQRPTGYAVMVTRAVV